MSGRGVRRGGRHVGDDPPPRPSRAPWLVVAAAVLFGLVVLYPETRDVWSLNDASIHASMVRWAALRIREGHLPFDGWYPYLSLGASRFHHYQSLPHILTGAVSILLGPATFRWSLYLLLAAWPVAVYAGARLLEIERWPAAIAAAASPLIFSAPGMGLEWGSYVWRGSGAWAQLWGMWALPFAWGYSWRAVSGKGKLWPAAAVLGLTVCLHLLTGYLALVTLGVWVLLVPSEIWKRLARAVVVGAGALLVSAWMLVPLLRDAVWTTQDEFSRGTFYYDSFGAPKILGWLVRGQLFDYRRLPMLSILFAAGLVVAIVGARRREPSRAVLGAGALSLVLFFGRPTLGPLLKVLPGGADLFLRRFLSGVHLSGLYLIGLGGAWAAAAAIRAVRRVRIERVPWVPAAAAAALIALFLAPAAAERIGFERQGAVWIGQQDQADQTDGAAFASLVRRAQAEGPGRIFASLRSGTPTTYKISSVPTFAALLDLDADQVGFTRPTWSIMSGVEYRFAIYRASDPALFGVRYAILPDGTPPPPGFLQLATSGRHVLWTDPANGYVSVADTVAAIAADRTNLGKRMRSVLDSDLPGRDMLPLLAFAGHDPGSPTLGPTSYPSTPPGSVAEQRADPADGSFRATVNLDRPAAVILHASFDPRWVAVVDGTKQAVFPVAPGLVAVNVPAGAHMVAFTYRPFPWYGPLFLVLVVALLVLALADRRRWLRVS